MRSIRSTNNNRRRVRAKAAARASWDRVYENWHEHELIEPCGQCGGTGTIEGGLSGDGPDEECPVCDGSGRLPE